MEGLALGDNKQQPENTPLMPREGFCIKSNTLSDKTSEPLCLSSVLVGHLSKVRRRALDLSTNKTEVAQICKENQHRRGGEDESLTDTTITDCYLKH